jgi:hypothetical protein
MLNQTTMLQREGIPMVASEFMVGTRTDVIPRIPSVRGIEITPSLISSLCGRTSSFVTVLKTAAAGQIQADNTKDSDLIGDPLPNPATKPSSSQNCTQPKQANPPLNRTYHSDLRPLPHAR